MSDAYEEFIEGERLLRTPPGARHELICARLHQKTAVSIGKMSVTKQLPPRSIVQISGSTFVRPDLALITNATGKLWLAAEIISSDDHKSDTVIKKQIYEELNVPRLWMVDPRYNNVEVYHGSQYGLVLKKILAGQEILADEFLPDFQLIIDILFAEA
jgi:Uma2 family endonuclease